mgnify:CR=1 FL=1
MIGNKIRQGKIWCKSTVKNRFGSGYTHKKLKSNWIQMVRDHDEPLEVYVMEDCKCPTLDSQISKIFGMK